MTSPYGLSSYKMEEDLAMHIRKAITPEESAPKQKHVRACIVYTWDIKSSGSFWGQLKNQPVLGDEVMTFKAMITFHKVVKDGHPQVLRDGISEAHWLDALVRGVSHLGNRGYIVLIKAYTQFLHAKLNFHRAYPAFNGSFDYEEYVSLRGIEDPNEGFETISDLLELLNKLDVFQKLVFANLRTGINNECRIAALVPLVEESHGIYQFLVSMLTAMHQIEVLAPLREKFNASHYALYKFYFECSNIRYLTSLITIPKLSQDPPDFLAQGPPTKQPKGKAKAKDPAEGIDIAEQQRMLDEFEAQRLQREQQEQMQQQQQFMEEQRRLELQRQQEELQRQIEFQRQQEMMRQQEEERMRMLQLQQQQQQQQAFKQMEAQMLQQRAMELQRELDMYRSQAMRDKGQLDEANLRMKALENQLAQVSLQQNSAKDDVIKKLQDELNQWKQKYEALAKLYAQLRIEHLDLLTKFKEVRDGGNKAAEESRKAADKANAELEAKSSELVALLVERDKLKAQVDGIRREYEDRIQSLERELAQTQAAYASTQSKGNEVESMLAKYSADKASLEALVRQKQALVDEYMGRLESANAQLQLLASKNNQESSVLQAGLDQTLVAFAALQASSAENERKMQAQIQQLQAEHLIQLNKMMDNILMYGMKKIDDAVYELYTHQGNQTASPEYVLSLLEVTHTSCAEFASSFVRLVQGGDQSETITYSNGFAHAVVQLLFNAKGVLRLAKDDETADQLLKAVERGAVSARVFFEKLLSDKLLTLSAQERPQYILSISKQTQGEMDAMIPLFEKLVPEQVAVTAEVSVDDIGELVEREMRKAAQAIVNASQRLDEILPNASNVHSAIIGAAKLLTDAIAILIQRATESQQEIVQQGKGSTTSGAFYKKNNKWTEGLISAAKACAEATTFLVDGASGLVNGTHSMEQLIVAAQEVSVATTQLVAASRVKAVLYSKTQDRLEQAASDVKDATKQLVRAAKEAAKRDAEQQAQSELQSLGHHQYKVVEMEQQVKILELEKDLQNARYKLAEIRKSGYRE